MSFRYIFNTSGDYVAFISDDYLFSSEQNWLGVVRDGNEVYDPAGKHLGIVLDDDRIARNKMEFKLPITPPLKPLRPLRPLKPLKRLRMPRLPYPYEDIFENKYQSTTTFVPILSFDDLLGSEIYAEDGKFLGVISLNRHDGRSLANIYGAYGSKYSADSIFNSYGMYGSRYSALSPFNPYSSMPPKVTRDGKLLGLLSVNPYVTNRIDADKFIKWWNSKQ